MSSVASPAAQLKRKSKLLPGPSFPCQFLMISLSVYFFKHFSFPQCSGLTVFLVIIC